MAPWTWARLAVVFGCLSALVACAEPTRVDVEPGSFTDTTELEGIRYTAGVRERGDTLLGVVVLTNPADTAVLANLAGGCTVTLVAHTTPARSGAPVWDSQLTLGVGASKFIRGCYLDLLYLTVPPRGRTEVIERVPKAAILEDLTRPGRYYLSARVSFGDVPESFPDEILLPAGTMVIGR
jgi:hypothetical protein